MTAEENLREAIAHRVLDDLNTRRAFRRVLDECDDDILADIKSAIVDAALAAIAAEGLKLLKREPTEEMERAMMCAESEDGGCEVIWAAGWDAAPAIPAKGADDGENPGTAEPS